MQFIASFREQDSEDALAALKGLESREGGIMACPLFTAEGWFALITWPDWPPAKAESIGRHVQEFQDAHPQLRPVPEYSKEWTSASRGREADYESAEAIGTRFSAPFDGEVAWVEAWKDRKGQITATCSVRGVGKFALELAWRSSSVQPLGSLGAEQYDAFRRASREVIAWAASRIQPVLDVLAKRLRELYGQRFRGLYVFGSYARPDAGVKLTEDSDLDVAVLLTDMQSSYAEIQATSGITTELSLEYGLAISLVHLREADFREGRTNFTRVISKYAIPVR
jgi:uncharacterized protein